MGDFFFVVKCLIVTIAIVVMMQIKIGGRTVETYATNWIHRSSIIHQLQDVAEGAVKAGKNGSREVAGLFEDAKDQALDATGSHSTEASTGFFKIKRSDAYYRQKERERLKQLGLSSDSNSDSRSDSRATDSDGDTDSQATD